MNRIIKLAIPVLLLLILCTALSGASAQEVAIKAEDGGDLPDNIHIDKTFTVLIIRDGTPVPAGTAVVFRLPASGGTPTYVSTDGDGKARYKPLIPGTLGIKVLDGLATAAEATATVPNDGGVSSSDVSTTTSSSSGGGGDGTYPPGWGETPTPTPTATPASAAAPESTVASTEAPTVAPNEAPTKAPTAAPTEIATTKVEAKGTPGFGAVLTVFAIAGLLVATYLVMRRRE